MAERRGNMEIYSFHIQSIQEDLNTLLQLYQKATTEDERYYIFHQLLYLNRLLSQRLVKSSKLKKLEPESYRQRIANAQNQKLDFYTPLDSLTRMLCYYWSDNLRKMETLYINRSQLHNIILTKEEYYKTIMQFLKTNFPNDFLLANDIFTKGQIRVKRTLHKPSANILYIESLTKVYIDIFYNRRLTCYDAGIAIHEFGHASSFASSEKWQSKDYLLEEVIASLYEILFTEYCSNDAMTKQNNLGYLFKSIGTYYLDNYFDSTKTSDSSYQYYLGTIDSLYGQVIATTILANSNNLEELHQKIDYLKKNAPFIPAFQLLSNIGIREDDLLFTAKHMKEIVLRK